MYKVYKIYNLNDEQYYLFSSSNKSVKCKILHHYISKYKKSLLKNEPTTMDDVFIIIQKNNVLIEEINREFKDKFECNNYIYTQMSNDNNCVNTKHNEYIKNDINKITVGDRGPIRTKQEQNRINYLRKKQKKANQV